MKKGWSQETSTISKNHQGLLWKPIFCLVGKSGRNGQILIYIWPSKIEPRKY
jgi:hypothetical protein